MTSATKIIVNTIATYGRTVFAMALGLFSGRWLLQALGPVDYGLIGVVGALIPFVTFLNNLTSASVARFFALSIGRNNKEETNRWFNVALSIHTVLPALLVAIGYPIGHWAILNFFNIPPERISTAQWVFRFSLVSAFCAMSLSPFTGMFTAKQRIYEMSLWGIVQTMCSFGLTYSLTVYYKGDSWLLYGGGSAFIGIALGFCMMLRARMLFEECQLRVKYWWDWESIRAVTSFAGWQLFGVAGRLLRGQGTAILLNKYFNPAQFPDVNSSYAVGNSVSTYTQTLSTALLGAFTPEITAKEGQGKREHVLLYSLDVARSHTLVVATSASHMPRAFEIIRDRGLTTVSAPCDFTQTSCDAPEFSLSNFPLPSEHGFELSKRAAHEWLGALYESVIR